MTIREYRKPATLEEALGILKERKDAAVLAGLTALKLTGREIGIGVDITGLGLDGIREEGDHLVIGACASFLRIEESPICRGFRGGAIARAAASVGGIQLRAHITAGGAACSRWAVSTFAAALLAADARMVFARGGEIGFEAFPGRRIEADILAELRIPRGGRISLLAERISALDFPLLTVAAAAGGPAGSGTAAPRIAVGARPGGPVLALKAAEAWAQGSGAAEAAAIASEELDFGDDQRASAWYRKKLCAVLVERALKENHGEEAAG